MSWRGATVLAANECRTGSVERRGGKGGDGCGEGEANDGRRAGGGRTADPQAVTGVAARVVGTGAWICHRTPTRKASDFGKQTYTLLGYK